MVPWDCLQNVSIKQNRTLARFLVEIIRRVVVSCVHFGNEPRVNSSNPLTRYYVAALYAAVVFFYPIQPDFAALLGLVANIISACPAASASAFGSRSLSCFKVAL